MAYTENIFCRLALRRAREASPGERVYIERDQGEQN